MRMHQHSPAEPLTLATLLIVHPNPDETQALVSVLSDEPYELHSAGSIAEAMKVLGAHEIDAVIADDTLAGSTESEFFGQLRVNWPAIIRILVGNDERVRSARRFPRFGWAHHYLPLSQGYVDLALMLYNSLVQRSFLPPESEGVLPLPPLTANSVPPSNRTPSSW